MNVERITVSLPANLRADAQAAAESAGLALSTVVADALTTWLRNQQLGDWLAEFQAEHGAFTEEELRDVAASTGVPYVPKRQKKPAA